MDGLVAPITEVSAGIYSGEDERYASYWAKIMAFWVEIRALALLKEIQKSRVAELDQRMNELPNTIARFNGTRSSEDRQGLKSKLIASFLEIWQDIWVVVVATQVFWSIRREFTPLTRDEILKGLPVFGERKKTQDEKV